MNAARSANRWSERTTPIGAAARAFLVLKLAACTDVTDITVSVQRRLTIASFNKTVLSSLTASWPTLLMTVISAAPGRRPYRNCR